MSLDLYLDERFQKLYSKLDEVLSCLKDKSNSLNKSSVYDNKALASKLKASTRTLQKWRDNHFIEFCQVGSKVFYTEEQVNKFIARYSNGDRKNLLTIKNIRYERHK